MVEVVDLSLADVAVFMGLLLVSLCVGFYFAFRERNQSADSFLLNNESMNPWAAGLSIFVSMISALTIIGDPVEVYSYGNAMIWRMAGGVLGIYTCCYVFLPKIYELRLYSLFTYTELRFKSVAVSRLTLACGMGGLLVHMMGLSYLTALSFSTVIPISDLASLFILNTVAIIYTMCGGMKAVIWTDCLQSSVMLMSLLIVCGKLWFILGTDKIRDVCDQTNCNQWTDLRLNIFRRTSSWGYAVSQFVSFGFSVSFGQYFMQRCVACNSLTDARKALTFGLMLSLVCLSILTPLTGMAALAYFDGKDPVECGNIAKSDQIVPYLAAKIFSALPGLTGLFISAGFSATLSTLSTGLNSFATVFFKSVYLEKIDEKKMIRYQRVFMFVFGYVVIGLAMLMRSLPDTIVSITMAVSTGSAICAAFSFICGMLSPRFNAKGIITGYLVALMPTAITLIGMFFFPRPASLLNTTARTSAQCSINGTETVAQLVMNSTESTTISQEELIEDYPVWHFIFWLSPYFQASFVATVFCIVSYVVSISTEQAEQKVDESLLVELFQAPFYPAFVRRFFRHSRDYVSDADEKKELAKLYS